MIPPQAAVFFMAVLSEPGYTDTEYARAEQLAEARWLRYLACPARAGFQGSGGVPDGTTCAEPVRVDMAVVPPPAPPPQGGSGPMAAVVARGAAAAAQIAAAAASAAGRESVSGSEAYTTGFTAGYGTGFAEGFVAAQQAAPRVSD